MVRTVALLTEKYLVEAVRTPAIAISCLVPLIIMLMLRFTMGDYLIEAGGRDAQTFSFFVFTYVLLFEGVMVASMTVLYAMAEEREKRVQRTLALAGVSTVHLLIARGLTTELIIGLSCGLCYLIFGAPLEGLAPFIAVALVGSLPLVLISLPLGLAARNQMDVMVLDTPLIFLAIGPMLITYSETLSPFIIFFPTGGLFELAWMTPAEWTLANLIAPFLSILVWTILATIALVVAYRHIPHSEDI